MRMTSGARYKAFGNGYIWGIDTRPVNVIQVGKQAHPNKFENTVSEFVHGDWVDDRELLTDARLVDSRTDINVKEFTYEKGGRTYWRRIEYDGETIRDSTNVPDAKYNVMLRGLTAFHHRNWGLMPKGSDCTPFVERKAERGWDQEFTKRDGVSKKKKVMYKTDHDPNTGVTQFTMEVDGYGFPGKKQFISSREWVAGIEKPKTGIPEYDAAFSEATKELGTLILYEKKGSLFKRKPKRALAAGYPTYCSVFGRDSDITNYGLVYASPELVRENIEFRLERLGKKRNVSTAEEPGKALHEWNMDELTARGIMGKQFPNFIGTDESPLLGISIARYSRITGDDSLIRNNRKRIRRLWNYIERSRDSHGYLGYDSDIFEKDEKGKSKRVYFTRNQTWRDSDEGIIGPDGKMPKQPIRTLWDQCCLYGMISEMQELSKSSPKASRELEKTLGVRGVGSYLERDRKKLGEAINRDFWMEDLGAYAIALDKDYNQIKTVNSDACLGLYYKVFDEKNAQRFIDDALLNKERLLDDWGIRTVSKEHTQVYRPNGYHVGGVWPFQTTFAAIGAENYGRSDRTSRLSRMNQDLATRLGSLPEVLDAESGRNPKAQEGSCNPQAWSAGTMLFMHYECNNKTKMKNNY